jgi:hypothetical protein
MRHLLSVLVAAILCLAQPLAQQAPSLLIRNVTLIDGSGGEPRAGVDFLIVDADPATDIRNTRRIRYVIKDGRIVHTARPKER